MDRMIATVKSNAEAALQADEQSGSPGDAAVRAGRARIGGTQQHERNSRQIEKYRRRH